MQIPLNTPATKENIEKLDFMKILKRESKEMINRVKGEPIEWEKLFANFISDKRLKSRT